MYGSAEELVQAASKQVRQGGRGRGAPQHRAASDIHGQEVADQRAGLRDNLGYKLDLDIIVLEIK